MRAAAAATWRLDTRAWSVRGRELFPGVIASGVAPGDTVVTDGHLRLVPGARISVKQPPTGQQQAAP